MTPFRVHLKPGQPIVDQVAIAAIRAFLSGTMMPGDAFPSVRTLAADLRIHPNTAHKVIQKLVRDRWLDVHSGKGTIVTQKPAAREGEQLRLLDTKVEPLVTEAKSAGFSIDELQRAIARRWAALDEQESGS